MGAFSDKLKAQDEIKRVRQELVVLEDRLKEEAILRENFSKDKFVLESQLKEAQDNIVKLTSLFEKEKFESRQRIFYLIKEIKLLSKENIQIKDARARLEEKLSLSEELNIRYSERLHSLSELKKAIREVKIEARQKKRGKIFFWEPSVKKSKLERGRAFSLSDGNRGYIVKDGAVTYKPRLKIEVKPADD